MLKDEEKYGIKKFKTYQDFGKKVYKIRENVVKNLKKLKENNNLVIGYFVREDTFKSGEKIGFSVSIEVNFIRPVLYTTGKNYIIQSTTWGLRIYRASYPNDREFTKETVTKRILEFIDVFSVALLEQNEK